MIGRRFVPAFLLALLVACAAAPAVLAAPHLDGTFAVPGLDGNSKLVQGPDGNIWATLPASESTVAKIEPNGQVTEYDLDGVLPVPGASGITVGPEGRLWFTFSGGVASFLPGNPEMSVEKTLLAPGLGPFHSIATGPDGKLWIAAVERLIQIAPSNPDAPDIFPIGGLDPRDIDVAGPRLVVADFFEIAESGRILTFEPAKGEFESFDINAGSQGVAGSPSGQIAFGVQKSPPTELGLINFPAAPLATPAPGTDPFGVTFGPDGAYWFVEFLTNSLARLTPDNKLTTPVQLPPGSQPKQIAAGPNNTLWVTLIPEDAAQTRIARIVDVVSPPGPPVAPSKPQPAPVPRTVLATGPKTFKTAGAKAKVLFKFSSPDAGATFECRQIRLTKKKSKPPAFAACKSPKTYKLTPGSYRFEVRATRAALADATPENRSFKVVRAAKKRR
ncbi:MAG TPA: hypothetical protein VF081_03845 [Solirubrobacterales bacterium]